MENSTSLTFLTDYFPGITFVLDENVEFTRSNRSTCFLKHFDMTFASIPFSLSHEFDIHETMPGAVFLMANFPEGIVPELRRHRDGTVRLNSHIFAQVVLLLVKHLRVHPDLKELKNVRIVHYPHEEDIPCQSDIIQQDGTYFARLANDTFIGLTKTGIIRLNQ
jgi:hypothetical protein